MGFQAESAGVKTMDVKYDFTRYSKSSFGILKVGENQWMKKLYDGQLSFSCAQAYIDQGIQTNNQEQGDPDEGIFAQLRVRNPLIARMRELLGDDLEEYQRGDFIMLRRKSACRKPIFCVYTIRTFDFEDQLRHTGLNRVSIPINQRIYENLLTGHPVNALLSDEQEKRKLMSVFFNSEPFFSAVEKALKYRYCEPMRSDEVKYDIKEHEEFFVEPSSEYKELFFKRERYSYQHEVRILLTERTFGRKPARFNVEIGTVDSRLIFERLTHIQTLMTVYNKSVPTLS